MSRILFNDININLSLGELITRKKYEKKYYNLENFGIINISRIPLQKSAYKNNPNIDFEDVKLKSLFELKKSISSNIQSINTKNHSIEKKKIIEQLSIDFLERIEKANNIKKVVLCGNFAQAFYNQIKEDLSKNKVFNQVQIINTLHPSRKQWVNSFSINNMLDKLK